MSAHTGVAQPPTLSPRRRKTRPAVRAADKAAYWIITAGGILVIVAVLGIMAFLVAVVAPLFRGAQVSGPIHYPLFAASSVPDLLFAELNEYKSLGAALTHAGRLVVFEGRTGHMVEQQDLLPSEPKVTAFARAARGGPVAFGFADGTVRLGQITLGAKGCEAQLDGPLAIGAPGVPIHLLDLKVSESGEIFTALKANGELLLSEISRRKNLLTGKTTTRVTDRTIPFSRLPKSPAFLLQSTRGDEVYLAWRDGLVQRYNLSYLKEPVLAETRDLIAHPDNELTDFRYMFGEQSLIASDSLGNVTIWFRLKRVNEVGFGTADGCKLVPAHELEPHKSSVCAVAVSTRDKGLVTATTSGEVFLRHLTSEQVLGRMAISPNAATPRDIATVQFTPKADGIFAVDGSGGAWLWDVRNPHPETTWKTIFGRLWYEGHPKPTFTWQSSSANDDFEPKFSLVPLIFGTFKATVYALLFAVPIALLAAIYTSEFLDKELRPLLKSSIEMMASLPSVVLGFIAALVLAPVVENWVIAVVTGFALIPLIALGIGYLSQMLPSRMAVRIQGWPQLAMVIVAVGVTVLATRHLAVCVERPVFQGDFEGWLDGRVGSGFPLWAVLAWPWALALVWLGQRTLIAEPIRERSAGWTRAQLGLVELARFVGLLAVSTLLAVLAAKALAAMGFDPRGALVGTYVQRNTLIVGFVMGFAVIPIIYTISEDAISSVPEHLRSASLGCGATRWQTAIRVIVPMAMSGIFSAIMIGLGRAVGETMIVVMAAGNTPLMDINVFNGLRALSANIAVELPEAVKDSTLYRMLFLAALTLFLLTFVINTVAEVVRMRFRRRVFQL